MKSKLIGSTIVNFINMAVMFLISFLMTPVLLHRVGSEQYGLWVFLGIFSISGYFSLLDLGMQGAAIKYIAEYHAIGDRVRLNKVINAIVVFFTLAGLVSGFSLFIVNNLFIEKIFNIPMSYLPVVKILINLISVSLLFQFPAMAFSAVIEGMQRYDLLRGVNIVVTLLSNIVIFCYLKYNNGIWFLTVTMLISSLALSLIFFVIVSKILPEMKISLLHCEYDTFCRLFNISGKLFLSRLVGLVFNNTDKILMGMILTVTVMTDFDIINKVHVIILTIMSSVNQALIPYSSQLSALNNENVLRKLFLRGTKYAVIITLPALIFFTAMSKEFLTVWVGTEYCRLSLLLQFYICHCFITVLTGVASTMMVGMNRVKEILKISLFMASVKLLISVSFIFHYGIKGLVAGTVIAYLIGQLFAARLFLKILKTDLRMFLDSVVIKPFGMAVVVYSGVILLKQFLAFNNIAQLALFACLIYLVYGAAYILIDREEQNLLVGYIPQFKL